MREKGLKKEFFNYLAIGLLLQPIKQYKEENQDTQPVAKQRAFYDFQLAYWYEIKSLVEDYAEENQDFFTLHLRAGADKEQNPTGLYWYSEADGQKQFTSLHTRKENIKHFKTLSIAELEARMLDEYINFSMSDTDFIGRKWSDNPLTEQELSLLKDLTANAGTAQKQKALKKSDFPQGIKILAKAGLLEWLANANAYILHRPWKLIISNHGKWKQEAEALLKEKDIKPVWYFWSNKGYIVKRSGKKYAEQGLERTLDTF